MQEASAVASIFASPVVQWSGAAVFVTAAIGVVVRLMTRGVRDVNESVKDAHLNKATQTLITALQAELTTERTLRSAVEIKAERLRDLISDQQSKMSSELATLNANFAGIQRENVLLRAENVVLKEKLETANSDLLKLQMEMSRHMMTIEGMQGQISRLQKANDDLSRRQHGSA